MDFAKRNQKGTKVIGLSVVSRIQWLKGVSREPQLSWRNYLILHIIFELCHAY